MRTAEEIVEQLELRRTCLTHDEGGHCLSCEFNLELADSIEALAKERDEAKFDLFEVATKASVWKHELEKLREWKRRAVKVLAECEWLYFGALDECVVCDSYSPQHKEDCELAALLREATDAEPTDI